MTAFALLLQLVFVVFVGVAGGFSFARTSKSLIFFGCLEATTSRLGMAAFNL